MVERNEAGLWQLPQLLNQLGFHGGHCLLRLATAQLDSNLSGVTGTLRQRRSCRHPVEQPSPPETACQNAGVGPQGSTAFSGRGGIPHRRYLQVTVGARERLAPAYAGARVSRSGATPEPTVTVRMKEIASSRRHRDCGLVPRLRAP